MKKKVCITGSSGFIGSNLLKYLLEKYSEYEFISVDRREPTIIDKRIKHYITDINDGLSDVDNIDIVVHLAAIPSVRNSASRTEDVIKDNILATQNILNWCIDEIHPNRLIITSSSSVYDGSENIPMNESTSPLKPLSPYAVSKLACERMVQMYKDNDKLKDIETTIIRPFTTIGIGQRDEMCVQAVIDSCLNDKSFTLYGDGSVTRDFVDVQDVCSVIDRLIHMYHYDFPIYNIGTGVNHSVMEVISKVSTIIGKPITIEYEPPTIYDTKYTLADTTKIFYTTNWKPTITFEESLINQIEWQKSLV